MPSKSRIKWYCRVERGNFADWYCDYAYSVYQPESGWYPVNDQYRKDKWRFSKNRKT